MVADQIPTTAREVRLVRRPLGPLTTDHLGLVEVEVPELADGEVLVRNEWMLLASAYRDMMEVDCRLPIPGFAVGHPLYGRCVGTVVRSRSAGLREGDFVEHFFGWREYASGPVAAFSRRDPDELPAPEYFLCNGPTAWRGMVDIARVGEGDVVFVSGATSGVGSIAGQIAKCRGARLVIGSTGTKAKLPYLTDELGFDAAIDYHDGPVADQLRELAPDGITVFFDNIGGEQFEAAVEVAAPGARFALCGAMTEQGERGADRRPRTELMSIVAKQLEIRGFATFHTPQQVTQWNRQFSTWLREGRFVYPFTPLDGGLEAAPGALVALLERAYTGNVVLRLTHR
jgi:NADPH-dependent curcumin reductase CurA